MQVHIARVLLKAFAKRKAEAEMATFGRKRLVGQPVSGLELSDDRKTDNII